MAAYSKRLEFLKRAALIIVRQCGLEPLLQKGNHRKVVEWRNVYETTEFRPDPYPPTKSDLK